MSVIITAVVINGALLGIVGAMRLCHWYADRVSARYPKYVGRKR